MKTLEDHLRERLTDSRAMIGALDINHDRVLLHFGAIGELIRISFLIDDNEIRVVVPDDLQIAWQELDAAKRSRTPLDPAVPLDLVMVDGLLRVGEDGPQVNVPTEFHAQIVYRDGALFPAAGGSEIVLPPDYLASQSKLDPAVPLAAVYVDGKLYAGEGGPEIELPDAFLTDLAAALGEGETPPAASTPPAPEPVDPDKLNKEKLIEIALAEGVEIADDDTKKVIAGKINAKRGIAAA